MKGDAKKPATAGKPRPKPKSRIKQIWCMFNPVSEEAARGLLDSHLSPSEEKAQLSKAFNLDQITEDSIRFLLLELYHKMLVFGKSRVPPFDPRKLSTLLGILDVSVRKAMRKDISQQKFYEMFKQLLLMHSVQRPPYSLCVFSADDLRTVADFFVEDVYRFYPLYHFLFHPRYETTLSTDTLFKVGLPDETPIAPDMKEIKPLEVPDLRGFIQMTAEEAEAEARAKEIDDILNVARTKLEKELQERMKKQDDEFVVKMKGHGKK